MATAGVQARLSPPQGEGWAMPAVKTGIFEEAGVQLVQRKNGIGTWKCEDACGPCRRKQMWSEWSQTEGEQYAL